jgi:hypothetical protein
MDSALGSDREREAVRRVCDRAERLHPVGSRGTGAGEGPADLVLSVQGEALPSRGELEKLAARAGKLLVLVLPNPARIGAAAFGTRRAGASGLRAATEEVVRVLWELGRVREHAYLVLPRPVEIVAALQGSLAAPDVALAPVGALVRRSASLHALVVDTTPRTPQARRRLRTLQGTGDAR